MFDQAAWRPGEERALVEAKIQLACVDRDGTLVPLPDLPP
jgi:acyl-CoA thioesterase FadM